MIEGKGITDSKDLRQGSDASINNHKIIFRGYYASYP